MKNLITTLLIIGVIGYGGYYMYSEGIIKFNQTPGNSMNLDSTNGSNSEYGLSIDSPMVITGVYSMEKAQEAMTYYINQKHQEKTGQNCTDINDACNFTVTNVIEGRSYPDGSIRDILELSNTSGMKYYFDVTEINSYMKSQQ
jgi:hypothetical protein